MTILLPQKSPNGIYGRNKQLSASPSTSPRWGEEYTSGRTQNIPKFKQKCSFLLSSCTAQLLPAETSVTTWPAAHSSTTSEATSSYSYAYHPALYGPKPPHHHFHTKSPRGPSKSAQNPGIPHLLSSWVIEMPQHLQRDSQAAAIMIQSPMIAATALIIGDQTSPLALHTYTCLY